MAQTYPDIYYHSLEDEGFELSKDEWQDRKLGFVEIYNWMYHIGDLFTITCTFMRIDGESDSEESMLFDWANDTEIPIHLTGLSQARTLIRILTPR